MINGCSPQMIRIIIIIKASKGGSAIIVPMLITSLEMVYILFFVLTTREIETSAKNYIFILIRVPSL